jgi:tRNA pseudouridine-54 N-methylase
VIVAAKAFVALRGDEQDARTIRFSRSTLDHMNESICKNYSINELIRRLEHGFEESEKPPRKRQTSQPCVSVLEYLFVLFLFLWAMRFMVGFLLE